MQLSQGQRQRLSDRLKDIETDSDGHPEIGARAGRLRARLDKDNDESVVTAIVEFLIDIVPPGSANAPPDRV